jgi:hypothetical protein
MPSSISSSTSAIPSPKEKTATKDARFALLASEKSPPPPAPARPPAARLRRSWAAGIAAYRGRRATRPPPSAT